MADQKGLAQARNRARQDKEKEREGEMQPPDLSGVVEISKKNRQPQPIKGLGALAGFSFEGFDNPPGGEPAAAEESEDRLPDADLDPDPKLDAVFEALDLTGAVTHEPADPNDRTEGGPMADKALANQEMTPMEKLLAGLAAEEKAIQTQERDITEERLTVPQLLTKVGEHEQAMAVAVANKMPDVAARHKTLIATIFAASPRTKAAYDARKATAEAQARQTAKRTKDAEHVATRNEALQQIEGLLSADPEGTDSVLEAEHRLEQDPETPVKLLVRMAHGEQVLLKVFSTTGYNNSQVLKFEVLACTPDVHVPPTPSTVQEKQGDWKNRSFVSPRFVWDERRYPGEYNADHYGAIKSQLAYLRSREVSRHMAEDRLAQASEGAELSVTQLLVEGLPGKALVSDLPFNPRQDSRTTAIANIVVEREGEPAEMELFQGGTKAPFMPIRVLAFKVEPSMASLWTLIAKNVPIYVRASVAQHMADGQPVLMSNGVPRAIINVVLRDDPSGYPSFRHLEDDWRANNGKEPLQDTDGKVAELDAKEKGWLEQFPVQKELLRYLFHRALLSEWLKAHPAPQADEAPSESGAVAPAKDEGEPPKPSRRRRATPAIAQ